MGERERERERKREREREGEMEREGVEGGRKHQTRSCESVAGIDVFYTSINIVLYAF